MHKGNNSAELYLISPDSTIQKLAFLMQRSRLQVHKQGSALGRSVDLAKVSNYDELFAELDNLFEFNGELKSRNKNWLLVYVDDENDKMLVGDDPWE